jgi:antitoxin component YwqK of YwqJK toxin-antitoxin module
MQNNVYKNGQTISEQNGNRLTYYYKNGKVKAQGIFENNLMQGEWIFYRETGQLWQIGNFKDSLKHGHFVRYDRKDQVEMDENFVGGKKVKK